MNTKYPGSSIEFSISVCDSDKIDEAMALNESNIASINENDTSMRKELKYLRCQILDTINEDFEGEESTANIFKDWSESDDEASKYSYTVAEI